MVYICHLHFFNVHFFNEEVYTVLRLCDEMTELKARTVCAEQIRRASLKLMCISIEGPPLEEFNFEEVG